MNKKFVKFEFSIYAAGPLVGAPVRPNKLNMPKSASGEGHVPPFHNSGEV